VEEIVVRSWTEALDALYAESWSEPLQRFRSVFAFRGYCGGGTGLETGISRLTDQPARVEDHLLRNFRKYAVSTPDREADSIWNWMALAQHYGLPTRMLDWTYSPLVALHFATSAMTGPDHDAVVWCIDYVRAKASLPPRLRESLHAHKCDVFTPELLADVAPQLSDLESLSGEPALLFLEPPSLDQRIVNQYALFSLLSTARAEPRHWLESHPDLSRRVRIDAKARWEIRDKLDQANVTERVLFPGMDGLCRWLARYYQTRDGGARPCD
jgi:hypothetical protein